MSDKVTKINAEISGKDKKNTALNQADVHRLLANPDTSARKELAEKLGNAFDSPNLSDKERTQAEAIIRVLAQDVEEKVRSALAQSLRTCPYLPHKVAIRMANDVEKVALPILKFSEILTDSDLVAIIQSQGEAKQIAIAGRKNVSETVSGSLVETGNLKVVTTLVDNKTAEISNASLNQVINNFGTNDHIQGSLIKRDSLPAEIIEKLTEHVSDEWAEVLRKEHKLPEAIVADMIMQAREQSLINVYGGAPPEQQAWKLAEKLHAKGKLTASLIIRMLCLGDTQFLYAALAAAADVSILNTRRLIDDSGKHGLKALWSQAKMPPERLNLVSTALEIANNTDFTGEQQNMQTRQRIMLERIITSLEDPHGEDAEYLLNRLSDLIQQHPLASHSKKSA